ncbi:MAG: insulinase family protein, partial [Erythrobacter sp.]|nr:insulinase family protein [Erythrobacter sp.]
TETVTIARHAEWTDRPDTVENRRDVLLRAVGARILSRRLQRLQRSEDPPFRGVSSGTSDIFEAARTTQIAAASEEGGWPRAVSTAVEEYRRMLEHGPTSSEIAEQTAGLRTAFENALANSQTRSNAAFANEAFRIARGESVPVGPQEDLALYERYEADFTPDAIRAAMRAEATALDDPLIRFSGKTAPAGGLAAVREAVKAALAKPVAPPEQSDVEDFAYTDFGTPGEVVTDARLPDLGIRTLRFANGVMLNLKTTNLSDDRVMVRLTLDGGKLLESRAEPLAVELTPLLAAGGLGRHSRDELQSILAGRSVGASFAAGDDVFVSNATTTPRDLELQLQLMAAYLTDPGYRAEGLGPWRRSLDDFFARLGRTPQSALSEGLGPILSDRDPRFTRQPIDAYRALDYDTLRAAIADRLENGALEIALVGDFDEEQAIGLVAQTFGALPPREAQFRSYDQGQRQRSFTDGRETYTLTHGGEDDQALLRLYWPTTDQTDWELSSRLTLLARVIDLALTETLREELGQTYSALSASSQSDTYTGYGTFAIGAEVDVAQIAEARAAMVATIERIIAEGPDADMVERARRPLLEGLANRFKTNTGWMAFTARAQSEEETIERMLLAPERQQAISPAELQALAARYLDPAEAVAIEVLPEAPSS